MKAASFSKGRSGAGSVKHGTPNMRGGRVKSAPKMRGSNFPSVPKAPSISSGRSQKDQPLGPEGTSGLSVAY